MKFFVVGGVYKDTSFTEIAQDAERHGPFDTYEEAKVVWAARSWSKVDDCHARFNIVESNDQ